ncbi:MAG: serine/threonine-protein kinase [Candidatus Melainabacteria bacterium]|nr:serine/threonine-protein kinase [Candidatus Melainabacteria bacterium]
MPRPERDFYEEYKFSYPIAEGGMGSVYMAEDTRNHRQCVIKQMRGIDVRSSEELEEARRLFTREVDILSDLDHAGIVKFLDYHVDADGRYFLVMEYILGNNLETTLHNYGPFTQDDAIKVGIQICEILEYLHEDNMPLKPSILYRDLKPSNLMLTPEGQVIFIDFGIARHFMPSDAATRVITAGYSPPEQYFGRPEFRSDLYALGATLAHLVTGVRPRPLVTSVPSQQNAPVTESFDTLIARLTAHSPQDRPPDARSVRHSLFKIYQEIHPDFEIPDEVFQAPAESHEDQFVSQKIMRTGLKAASSAAKRLPPERGPECESYTDDEMPSSIAKMFENLNKPKSSIRTTAQLDQRETLIDQDKKPPNKVATRENLATSKSLRTTIDRHQPSDSVWDRFVKWVTRKG